MPDRYDPPERINPKALEMLYEADYVPDRRTESFRRRNNRDNDIISFSDLRFRFLLDHNDNIKVEEYKVHAGLLWLERRITSE